jgi:2-aminoadipate transaminase
MKLDADGIDTGALAGQLAKLKTAGISPKFIYTIPTVQMPTASVLPLERRWALLALARQYGIAVVEDECYADLVWSEAPTSLYALSPERVIHIGSFSKTLAPAMRLGYVVANRGVLNRMLSVKNDTGTAALDQMIAAEYLANHFWEHLKLLRIELHRKMQITVRAINREFGTAIQCWLPRGGPFVWLKLPNVVDVRDLIKPAADRGIVFNPGPELAADPAGARSSLRLCYAFPTEEAIEAGVATLAEVCHAVTGIPNRGAMRNDSAIRV